MRKALWMGGTIVVLGVLSLSAAVLLMDVNRFRESIQAQLEKGLHRPVALGRIGLRLFPLAITVSDFSVGETEGFATGRPFATAKQIGVRVGLLPLLRKQIQVDSLVLEQPALEVVRNREGTWNFATLGGNTGGSQARTSFVLGRLKIEDGSVAVTDLANRNARSVYDHLDVDLKDFGPDRAFQFTATARLPGSSNSALKIEGKGGPLGAGPMPFTAQAILDRASVAGLMRFMNSGKAQPFDGVLSGTADIDSTNALMKARGGLDFKDLRVGKAALAYPVRIDYRLSVDPQSGLVKAPQIGIKLGQLPLTVSAEVDTKASAINAGLKASRASLAEVLALIRTLGVADLDGAGIVSLEARIQGPYNRPAVLNYAGTGTLERATVRSQSLSKPLQIQNANLTFDKSTATLENLVASLGSSTLRGRMTARYAAAPEIAFGFNIDKLDIAELQQAVSGGTSKGTGTGAPPRGLNVKGSVDVGTILVSGVALNKVHSDVTLTNGVLTLAPLVAEMFGGKQTGSIIADMRSQPVKLALNTKVSGADAQKLLAATTSLKQTLYGLFAAGMDANLSLAPGAEMAKTLNGSLNLQLTNGRLAGVNVLNQLAGVAKFLGYRQNSQAYTDIVQLAGDLKVVNGMASTDNLKLHIEGGTLSAAGTMNLVTQALDLRVTGILDRTMSQKVGGSQIGGFLTTALANSTGELVIPALVTGTFAQPRFTPDAGRVAEMKLKNLLPTSKGAGPIGAVSEALKAPSTEKPSGAVRGIFGAIDALRGKNDKSSPNKP